MTDRELLELAAKAAGYLACAGRVCGLEGRLLHPREHGLLCDNDLYWNPLADDGDALRLAVELRIDIYLGRRGSVLAITSRGAVYDEKEIPDPLAATRRAIVRAAAEIGKAQSAASIGKEMK